MPSIFGQHCPSLNRQDDGTSHVREDQASKRARLEPPDRRHTAADISSIVQKMNKDELRAVLAAEAGRNPSALESLRQYFNLTRKNTSVMSVETYTDILMRP